MPYCMRNADVSDSGTDALHDVAMEKIGPKDNSRQRSYGFIMSTLGVVATCVGSILMLVITIILSRTLSGTAAETA